jgi:hypothetical protein
MLLVGLLENAVGMLEDVQFGDAQKNVQNMRRDRDYHGVDDQALTSLLSRSMF